jgi:hypothetical protein
LNDDIVVDPKVFEKSKIHPTIIEQVRQQMMAQSHLNRPKGKAKKKWQEIVRMSDTRFAVNCHKENDKTVMTGIRYALRKKT